MSLEASRVIRVCPASDTDIPVVANLFQFYQYDISESRGVVCLIL
jgi:hypothetical protein